MTVHVPSASRAEVGGDDAEPPLAPGRQAVGPRHETRVPHDQVGGQGAVGQQAAGPVDVGEEQVEQDRALLQAPLQGRPLVGAEDDGHRVEGPGARAAVLAGRAVLDALLVGRGAGSRRPRRAARRCPAPRARRRPSPARSAPPRWRRGPRRDARHPPCGTGSRRRTWSRTLGGLRLTPCTLTADGGAAGPVSGGAGRVCAASSSGTAPRRRDRRDVDGAPGHRPWCRNRAERRASASMALTGGSS